MFCECGSSSVGRASASQAEGHEFESRLPLLEIKKGCLKQASFLYSDNYTVYFKGIITDHLQPVSNNRCG